MPPESKIWGLVSRRPMLLGEPVQMLFYKLQSLEMILEYGHRMYALHLYEYVSVATHSTKT
jgi:hypothetical protein